MFKIFGLVTFCLLAWVIYNGKDEITFTKLTGNHLEHEETIRLDSLKKSNALLLFWRSDCAPCMREMVSLPELAANYSDLKILLISLQDTEEARKHVISNLPKNVEIMVADNARDTMQYFAGDKLVLPFGAMINSKGNICARGYGAVGPKTINEWMKIC